jgi:hypothetical protein
LFADESHGARGQCAVDRPLVVVQAVNHHGRIRDAAGYLTGSRNPIQDRQVDVHQNDIWRQPAGQIYGHCPVCRLADHPYVRLESEEHPQPAQHCWLIVYEQDLNWFHHTTSVAPGHEVPNRAGGGFEG